MCAEGIQEIRKGKILLNIIIKKRMYGNVWGFSFFKELKGRELFVLKKRGFLYLGEGMKMEIRMAFSAIILGMGLIIVLKKKSGK